MKSQIILMTFLCSAALNITQAATPLNWGSEHSISTSTLISEQWISPGRNIICVVPDFDKATAERLKEMFENIPGVTHVKPYTWDASIRFTVQKGAHVSVEDLQKAVADAGSDNLSRTEISQGL